MKHLYLTFFSIFCAIFTLKQELKCQNNFAIINLIPDSIITTNYVHCDSVLSIGFNTTPGISSGNDVNITINGTNFEPSTFTITINWGDGTTTTHQASALNYGVPLSVNPPIEHEYNALTMYPIGVTVVNNQNNTSASLNFQTYLTQCQTYMYAIVTVDCDNNGVADFQLSSGVPIIVSNGTTSYSDTTSGGVMQIPNLDPYNFYDVTIDPTWLNNNGYSVSSSLTGFYINSPFSTTTVPFTLICNNPSANSQCISGYVYCDVNSNGVYNPGVDTPVANAVVNITTNTGIVLTVNSNSNGYYSATYNAPANTPAVVQINYNWLSANNFTATNYIYTTITTACSAQNQELNFALVCPPPAPNNCVSGFVWCDTNGNGFFDTNESPIVGAPVSLQMPGNITVYSDSTGMFLYCGNTYLTTIIASINTLWLTNNGYSIANNQVPLIFMPVLNTQPTGFAVNCNPSTCNDLWVTVTPWIGYYQNYTNTIKLNFGNYGPGAAGNYTVTLTYPAGVTPVWSSISFPYTQSGNTITFNLSSLQSNFSNTDFIYFTVPTGIVDGTQHYYSATITGTGAVSDCNTTNNSSSLLQIVGNSYDPNDKSVNLPISIDVFSTDELTYVIRFQNTGTAPAQDIYILDTLSQNLDWPTFTLLETSHPMQLMNLGNGVMKFNFPQIWLPDSNNNEPASHGYIVYKIKEKVNNPVNSEIFNTAYIYFDWNPAIITNTTYNINTTTSAETIEKESYKIFPNPTIDILNIQSAGAIKSISILDLSGKIIESKVIENNSTAIDVCHLSSGTYVVEIESKTGNKTKNKFVRR